MRIKNLFFFSLSSDSKKTQWEDPRLQHVAITGPVSLFVYHPLMGLSSYLSLQGQMMKGIALNKGVERKAHLQISPLPTTHMPGLSYLKRAFKVVTSTLHNNLGMPVSQKVNSVKLTQQGRCAQDWYLK